MVRYLIRRTLFLILVLVLVSFITFLIFLKLPPGDPARLVAGRRTSPDILETIRHNLGLDKPWYVQYGRFAKGMLPWPGFFLHEQVYFSYDNFVPVKEEVFKRLPVTAVLALGAAVVWLTIGIPIGVVSAIRPRSRADRAGMIFALFGVSAPVFWLGYLFLYIFWFRLHLLPGSGLPLGQSTSWSGILASVFQGRFILPWLVLSLTFAAFYARMVRSNLIETMSEDFIRTARAKGLSERRVIFKHGLRAALTPVVTMFGIDLGILLGGAIITETVFNLPGLGQYLLNALQTNDIPAVMGITIFASFFIVVGNLVVDVVYAFLDPRVRYT
jgi:peptide/nickel transport system permease protein